MLMVSIKKIAWRLEPGLGYAIFVKCNEGLAQAAIRVGCALWGKGCILVASGIVLVLNWCKSRLQSYNMFFGFAIV